MQHGINANLLRKWITQRQSGKAIAVQQTASEVGPQNSSAFLAVQLSGAPDAGTAVPTKAPPASNHAVAQPMHLRVQLPNGVEVDLVAATPMQDLSVIMQTLSSLSCSR
jgi:hypothetical protein